MDLENISNISCEARNNYDKNMCENLNHDKIKDFLNNSLIFDKNKYLLDIKKDTLNNLSKEECATHSINNEYKGFTYNGDKNLCLIYDSNNLKENNINNDFDISYNSKKTFFKKKNNTDISDNDQLDLKNYFNETNNKYAYKDTIDEIIVNNESQCLDSCLNKYDNKCKAVTYMEINKECNFYDNLKFGINDNENYDIYSLNKENLKKKKDLVNNLLKDANNNKIYNYCTLDSNNKCVLADEDKEEIVDKMPLYDCSGIYSTNPFCTKEYTINDENNYNSNKKKEKYSLYTDCLDNSDLDDNIYNISCKKKFGNEYVFDDNMYNLENKVICENGGIMAKCKLDFEDKNILDSALNNKKVEHFNNNSTCDAKTCDAKKCDLNNDVLTSYIPKNCLIIIFLVSILLIMFLGIFL